MIGMCVGDCLLVISFAAEKYRSDLRSITSCARENTLPKRRSIYNATFTRFRTIYNFTWVLLLLSRCFSYFTMNNYDERLYKLIDIVVCEARRTTLLFSFPYHSE